MEFKFSHVLADVHVTEAGGDERHEIALLPSALSMTTAFAPVAIGLLLVLSGGIKALIGLALLAFGLIMVSSMRRIDITKEHIAFTPAFKKLSLPGAEKTVPRQAGSISVTPVKSDISLSMSGIRFFPLSANKLSVPTGEGHTLVLAYLSAEDAEKVAAF